MPGLGYQAIVLAGGDDKRLYPLSTGVVKALLPVANKPLLSYPLRTLSEAGLRHVYVVVSGEKPAATISSWIQTEYPASSGLQCEVVTVPEDYGTADALRAVASKVTAQTFVVVSGDLLTDLPVNALVASHQMNGAYATVLLSHRKTSPTTETKPGKAPKNVDYIGLCPKREHLLFYASSPETLRDLKVPLSVVRRHGNMTVSSDLADAHLYVFNRSVLSTLAAHPTLSSVRQDMLPFLTQNQFKLRTTQQEQQQQQQQRDASGSGAAAHSGGADVDGQGGGSELGFTTAKALPGAHYMAMSHDTAPQQPHHSGSACSLRVHVVEPGTNYCARVADVQSYGEVNREVADPHVAMHLSGLRPTKYENIVAASTTIGNKTTIAAACIVGENGALGDKSSIKRSVLGHGVKLGLNVKVINSVLMDGVVVGDNCTIQNSVICANAVLKERATVKDCQIGPGFTVSGGVEYKGEVLAKTAK
mmetsp:Transcript_15489/g.33608  ORF Transcript_15489/g.33608 Transcript_15489/m.33608 type:complete len:476 (-) Transcript_15489:297-1724(-)|eukprot:CAMPEP_0202902278 /NCGR_PEP_ID=MMETSP1392-20130828/16762_1 /ASSEMBLY_ACC=CAM_ASM_000868 /TAXON_ID=225041 /ORGANISM="Chlamydomonas chlamydogama, Strain SAG 11-48b" /LENGTH=475 /DNA_ID=CAMNT_0049589019 /DNA_START=139 /DNA_END=1566 /DNA_ORIENTATION=+